MESEHTRWRTKVLDAAPARLSTGAALRHFDFQTDTAVATLEAIAQGTSLLVRAPTGSGKTLMAYLAVAARLVHDREGCLLVLVPSRPLARQHAVDAAWLRELGLPVNLLLPDDRLVLWDAVLAGGGLVVTTPQSLINRLPRLRAKLPLTNLRAVIFDEIDIAVTKDFDERRDVWPAVDAVHEAGLPIIGYTGTALTEQQERFWQARGFASYLPDIPEGWLPLTKVDFHAVMHDDVTKRDLQITDDLGRASARFKAAGGDPRSWREITLAAKNAGGEYGDSARAILACHAERLLLFEGMQDGGLKYQTTADLVSEGSALVLCRYVASAVELHQRLSELGVRAVLAHGELPPAEADRRIRMLREGNAHVLVMTRDLGGRGLDFPEVSTAVLVSPRANYQAVAQELARIRSRRESPKTTTVLFYEATTEAAKALRLGDKLEKEHRYLGSTMFAVGGLPEVAEEDNREDVREWVLEESLAL